MFVFFLCVIELIDQRNLQVCVSDTSDIQYVDSWSLKWHTATHYSDSQQIQTRQTYKLNKYTRTKRLCEQLNALRAYRSSTNIDLSADWL